MAIYQDFFTRSDGGIGANWTNINGTFGVSSNQAKPLTLGSDSRAQSVYSEGTFGNDQYAQVTLINVSGYAGVVLRAATGAYTCYTAVAGSSNSVIQKAVAGTVTTVATGGPAFANSDVLRLEITGSLLTLYKNGVSVLTGVDTAIASGKAGIAGFNTSLIAADNWEGGDLGFPATLTYPFTVPVTANKTRITILDTVGESVSPFSLKTQQYDWQADRLAVEMSFPPLSRVDASKIMGFLAAMRGKVGTFEAGDPMGKTPQGVATGTPLVNGTNSARSGTLSIKGWTASVNGILKSGDWIQVRAAGGYKRLHMNLTDANSDSSGNAVHNIFPRIREDLVDGLSIVTANTKGTFRLAANQRQWDIETYLMANFTLSGIEAL